MANDIVFPSIIDYAWAWWATADIRATLLSEDYTPSEAHDFYDDIPAGVRLKEVTVTTGQRSVSGGKCFCDNLTFASVAGGDRAARVVFRIYDATEADSRIVVVRSAFKNGPIETNGGDIQTDMPVSDGVFGFW